MSFPAAERRAPIKTIMSRDGEASIKVIPVYQGDFVVSYYVQITQIGKAGKPEITAEINLSVEDTLSYVDFVELATNIKLTAV